MWVWFKKWTVSPIHFTTSTSGPYRRGPKGRFRKGHMELIRAEDHEYTSEGHELSVLLIEDVILRKGIELKAKETTKGKEKKKEI